MLAAAALALLLAPVAEAANVPRIKNIRIRENEGSGGTPSLYSIIGTLCSHADEEVGAVRAELDGVVVDLAEQDLWLSGVAALPAAPTADAGWTLTAYDAGGVELASFEGGLSADGTATVRRPGEAGDCGARVDCGDSGGDSGGHGESDPEAADLEALAATFTPDLALRIDLAGADAGEVASATLTLTEWVDTAECAERDRAGACVRYVQEAVETELELAFDDVCVVWGSDELEGPAPERAPARAWATDAGGRVLDRASVTATRPWADLGDGQSALPVIGVDGAELALLPWAGADGALTVLSAGWDPADPLPEVAELRLSGAALLDAGPTGAAQLARHSVQRTGSAPLPAGLSADEDLSIGIEGLPTDGLRLGDGALEAAPTDGAPYRVHVRAVDGGLVSVTTWAAHPDDLPETVRVSVRGEAGGEDIEISLDTEVSAVFAQTVHLGVDPRDLEIGGMVRLLGPADGRGARPKLAQGRVDGVVGVDPDGELDLSPVRTPPGALKRGDILIGGEPIGIELTGGPRPTPEATLERGDILIGGEPIGIEREAGDTVVPQAPPALRVSEGGYGNGYGLRATGQTHQTGLL